MKQLAGYPYHTLKHTHTHMQTERETHTQHFLLTRNTVVAVFHLNEFLNLFVPSPLVKDGNRRRRLPNQLMCQEGERTKWRDKKKSAPSLARSHTQAAGKDGERGDLVSKLDFHRSHLWCIHYSSLNRPELLCLYGWLCIKKLCECTVFLLSPFN